MRGLRGATSSKNMFRSPIPLLPLQPEHVFMTLSLILITRYQLLTTCSELCALNIISSNCSTQKAKMKMQKYQAPRGYVTCPRSPIRSNLFATLSSYLSTAYVPTGYRASQGQSPPPPYSQGLPDVEWKRTILKWVGVGGLGL